MLIPLPPKTRMHYVYQTQVAYLKSRSSSTTLLFMTQLRDALFPPMSLDFALSCLRNFTDAFLSMVTKGKWTWWILLGTPCSKLLWSSYLVKTMSHKQGYVYYCLCLSFLCIRPCIISLSCIWIHYYNLPWTLKLSLLLDFPLVLMLLTFCHP